MFASDWELTVVRRRLLSIWTVALVVSVWMPSPQYLLGQGPKAVEKGDYVLPIPPQQSAAWTPPPTKLPKTLVSTAVHLFQLGLGDPRGCEYREIEPDVYGHGHGVSRVAPPVGRKDAESGSRLSSSTGGSCRRLKHKGSALRSAGTARPIPWSPWAVRPICEATYWEP